jgi:hypothetical protein
MKTTEFELVGQALGTTTCFALVLLLTGCASETLFQSGFNASPLNGPPSSAQTVGTATTGGAVIVVTQPLPETSPEHWIRVSRGTDIQSPIGSFYGHFSKAGADGHYGMILAMKVGSDIAGNTGGNADKGSASVEIRPEPAALPYLLHLDFLPKQPAGQMIRINDDPAQTFGTFASDQPFTLSIGIDVHGGTATASVTLIGPGAGSNSSKENIALPDPRQAGPLGAIQLWMGFPWSGHFDATDVIVTYKP